MVQIKRKEDAIATQLLVWETVIGERDADFNHVSTGGKDAVKSVIGPNHPLKSKIDSYYNSIVSSVQSHVEYRRLSCGGWR